MTVEGIKEAIALLPKAERQALLDWILLSPTNELAYDDWDKEMAADFSPGGRGMRLVESVKRDIRLWKFSIENILHPYEAVADGAFRNRHR
jgi:hypothetical protein